MVIYRLPPESEDSKNPFSKNEEKRHFPEFVYIDDDKQHDYEPHHEEETAASSLQDLLKKKYPYNLRVITFFISFLALLLSSVSLIFLVLNTCLAALLFFQNERLNLNLKKCLRAFNKCLVFFLGFFVATFNPGFGFGIIILFFMMQGEQLSDPFMGRLFKMYQK